MMWLPRSKGLFEVGYLSTVRSKHLRLTNVAMVCAGQ